MAAVQSAVRLPSPEPGDPAPETFSRKRSPGSRSPSPRRNAPPLRRRSRSRSPRRPNGPLPRDIDRARAMERARQLEMRQKEEAEPAKPLTEEEKQAAAKAEYDKLLNMRSGGTYIPPARLRALQAQITDKTSKEYQRMAWEALKKSINGLINKVNVSNIKHIVPELFNENLIRGRGLFCRSIMKAQAASLPFTPIYAAMAAIVNTKLPQVGELLVHRLIIQFRKAFKRNDKSVCHSSTTFIAHLINQQVAHEMLAAQILLLLLHKPTDDSVEIAVGLMREVGQHIEEMNSQIALAVYDQFRSILHEADIDKRVQYMIEVLFQVRKDKYKDNLAVKEELDLVEEEDQITHRPGLDDQVSTEDGLNIFKFDADWEANEEAYKKLKAEILGEASGSEDEGDEDGSDESSDEEENETEKAMEIKDQSNTDLVNLRRSIYLTMSSGGFEEACHKLMRINLPTGREDELPSMIIECCSQERTYNKFFGLIGERFCKLNRLWRDLFEEMFAKYYDTIHRYETNRLRIIAQFFGHLLTSDGIGWHVFHSVKLNEEDTTSSSRIFIKILIEDLAQGLGMKGLAERMKSDELQPALTGMFPTDDPKNTRFSINFFTAIGMGMLTEGMREYLKNMPKPAPPALPAAKSPTPSSRGRSESVSSYSSYSSYSSRSESRSRSRSPPRRGGRRSITRSPPPKKKGSRRDASNSPSRSPRRRRDRSVSYDSRSPPSKRGRKQSESVSRSRSPPRRDAQKRRDDSVSVSRSPPAKHRAYSSSRSRSPALRRANGRRRSYTPSRSPPPKRGRSESKSPSPPRRTGKAPARDRSPPRKRAKSYSSRSCRSRSRTPPRRGAARAVSRSVSRSPLRKSAPARKRRRNSSSPDESRSRSPPPAKKPSHVEEKPKPNGKVDAKTVKEKAEEDLSHIHPSRRGLMGGGHGGRARASDFM
ncbi:pre-mRNA-splicing factor cwc22 [Vermiconidia calcicola]|uniref:Pre-mRNA-splicing factor cwc22 n=1 Tax=Vermiconidia calcicola TaxID=1690605 RepID=A0ACC3NR55_9PEZI|nr:pre-mRNA-splicing factor cwc22 [Vermiconidia calcicola]